MLKLKSNCGSILFQHIMDFSATWSDRQMYLRTVAVTCKLFRCGEEGKILTKCKHNSYPEFEGKGFRRTIYKSLEICILIRGTHRNKYLKWLSYKGTHEMYHICLSTHQPINRSPVGTTKLMMWFLELKTNLLHIIH